MMAEGGGRWMVERRKEVAGEVVWEGAMVRTLRALAALSTVT